MEIQKRSAKKKKEAMVRFSQTVLQAGGIEDSANPAFQELKEDLLRQMETAKDEYEKDHQWCSEQLRNVEKRCEEAQKEIRAHEVDIQETKNLIKQLETTDGTEVIKELTEKLKQSR